MSHAVDSFPETFIFDQTSVVTSSPIAQAQLINQEEETARAFKEAGLCHRRATCARMHNAQALHADTLGVFSK